MAAVISEFLSFFGLDALPPETMADLIPYLLTVLLGVCLVTAVFHVFGRLMEILLNYTRWR